MATGGFIFGAPGLPKTPQELAQMRAVAQALALHSTTAPKNVGEGLSAIGNALAYRSMMSDIAKAQDAGTASAAGAMGSIMPAFGGAAAPAPGAAPAPPPGPSIPPEALSPSPMSDAPAPMSGGTMPVQVSSADAPRGLRNNNPLNIEAGNFTQSQPGFNGSDGRFAKFASMDQGLGAADALLQSYAGKGINTVGGIVNRWAPPSDNNPTNAYAATVAKAIGVDPNAPVDMNDPNVRRGIIEAMAKFENGRPLPQVASNDPNFMPQAMSPEPAMPAMPLNGQGDAPVQMAGDLQPFTSPQNLQTVPTKPVTLPVGGQPQAAPQVAPQAGPSPTVQQLMKAAQNPWLSAGQQAIVKSLLEQKFKEQQQATDPLRQLQIKKAEADLQYGKSPESVREYEYAKRQGYQGSFQDWTASKRAGAGEYGLNAIWGQGPDGKPAIIQLGKSGKPILTPLPEGFQPNKDAQKVDLGTHWGILDPTTRQLVTTIPKDLRGAAREHVVGESQGKIQSTLPSDILSANQTVTQIDELLGSKGLDAIVGPLDQFRPSWTLGAEGRDALARYNQLKGKAFLQAYSTLRGGGAITEVEGVKAENAIARMDRAQREDDFRQALTEFRDAVKVGLQKLKEKGGVADAATSAQPAAPSVDDLLKKYGGK